MNVGLLFVVVRDMKRAIVSALGWPWLMVLAAFDKRR